MGPTDKLSICANCRKATQAKTHQCADCMKFFHSACTKLTTIMREETSVRVCRPCLAVLNSPSLGVRTRNASVSSTGSSASRPPSPPLLLSQSDSVLSAILAKVEAIDKRTASMEKSNELKFAEIEAKLTNCQASLDQIPALATRITAVETRITQIEDRLDTVDGDVPLSGPSTAVTARVGHMESAVKELSNTVARINADRAKLSSELLISGLCYGNCRDLRSLALAVFRAVLPDTSEEVLLSVRQLRSKVANAALTPDADSAPVPQNAATAGSSSPSLVVLLSTASIAHSIILAKARHRKLQSSELNPELLRQADVTVPLQPSLININEFLPPDLYKLRFAVKESAKKYGFSTFVRGGEVFIKKKKEDIATRISTLAELENFLSGSQ